MELILVQVAGTVAVGPLVAVEVVDIAETEEVVEEFKPMVPAGLGGLVEAVEVLGNQYTYHLNHNQDHHHLQEVVLEYLVNQMMVQVDWEQQVQLL